MLSFPTISLSPAVSNVRLADPAGAIPDAPLATPAVREIGPGSAPTEVQPARQEGSFANVLGRMIEEVNAKQGAAAEAVSALQSGQNVPLHQAVIAMEEANVSFQLMVEVRNKLLESYQELMRMQI